MPTVSTSSATVHPRATEAIDEIISLIQDLMDKIRLRQSGHVLTSKASELRQALAPQPRR